MRLFEIMWLVASLVSKVLQFGWSQHSSLCGWKSLMRESCWHQTAWCFERRCFTLLLNCKLLLLYGSFFWNYCSFNNLWWYGKVTHTAKYFIMHLMISSFYSHASFHSVGFQFWTVEIQNGVLLSDLKLKSLLGHFEIITKDSRSTSKGFNSDRPDGRICGPDFHNYLAFNLHCIYQDTSTFGGSWTHYYRELLGTHCC